MSVLFTPEKLESMRFEAYRIQGERLAVRIKMLHSKWVKWAGCRDIIKE